MSDPETVVSITGLVHVLRPDGRTYCGVIVWSDPRHEPRELRVCQLCDKHFPRELRL